MRACVYNRVSTEDQEREGTSLQSQLDACLELAGQEGYQVPKELVFAETYSGLTTERPRLSELRGKAKNGDMDAIIVHTPDRLSRVGEDILSLAKEFKLGGIKLLFVKEQWDDTLNGKLIAFILGWASEFEVAQFKERSLRGKKTRIREGRLVCGRGSKLFGYDYIPGKEQGQGIRRINKQESEWARSIFRWYVLEGLSLSKVVARLESLGVASPCGNNNWNNATVRSILKNRAYIGRTFAFTRNRIEAKTHRKEERRYKLTTTVFKPESEWVEVPNATPAIIGQELFDKAQAKLKRNWELALRNTSKKRAYLLSGYVFCSSCGRRYTGGTKSYQTKSGTKEYRYYYCKTDKRRWNAKNLENTVWEQIESVLTNPDTVKTAIEAISNTGDTNSYLDELSIITTKLKQMEVEKERIWLGLRISGDEAQFEQESKDIKARIEGLQRRKVEIEERIESAKQAELNLEGIEQACETVRANLGELTYENQRLALEALDVKVWLDMGKVTIEGIIPVNDGAIARSPCSGISNLHQPAPPLCFPHPSRWRA